MGLYIPFLLLTDVKDMESSHFAPQNGIPKNQSLYKSPKSRV